MSIVIYYSNECGGETVCVCVCVCFVRACVRESRERKKCPRDVVVVVVVHDQQQLPPFFCLIAAAAAAD